MTPKQPVLVTGCAGFIGSHLCESLLKDGVPVLGLDAFTAYYPPALKEENAALLRGYPHFNLVRGDVRDPATLESLLARGPLAGVVHLAAEVGVRESLRRPADYMDVNAVGTARLLQAVARLTPELHVVMASSSSVYGESQVVPYVETDPCSAPLSPYAASKRAAELVAQSLAAHGGPRVTAMRFFTVYGPRQRPEMAITSFARRMLRGETVELFAPQGSRRDYTFVLDVVAGIRLCLARAPGGPRFRAYNIAGGRPVPLRDLVTALEHALGVTAGVVEKPRAAGDMEQTWADMTRAREELGYVPRFSIEQGLEHSAPWLKGLAQGEPS